MDHVAQYQGPKRRANEVQVVNVTLSLFSFCYLELHILFLLVKFISLSGLFLTIWSFFVSLFEERMYPPDIHYMIDKKYNDVLFVTLTEVTKWPTEDSLKSYRN